MTMSTMIYDKSPSLCSGITSSSFTFLLHEKMLNVIDRALQRTCSPSTRELEVREVDGLTDRDMPPCRSVRVLTPHGNRSKMFRALGHFFVLQKRKHEPNQKQRVSCAFHRESASPRQPRVSRSRADARGTWEVTARLETVDVYEVRRC